MPSPRRTDLLLAVLVAAAGLAEMVALRQSWVVAALYCVAAAALPAARVAPVAVGAVWALALALDPDAVEPASWVAAYAAACLLTGLRAPRRAGLAAVAASLAIVMAALQWLSDFDPSLPFGLVAAFGAWAMGAALREALERNRRLGAAVERARLERGFAYERAAAAERERIAGELYDVLAHTLGAMLVQAAVAADLLRRDARAATGPLRTVADAGRDAIAETGRLVRLLRTPPSRGEPAPAEASERAAATDALLPAVFAVLGTIEIAAVGVEPLWAALAANWAAAALLAARRVVPLIMPPAVIAILAAPGIEDDPAAWLAPIALACVAAGLHVRRTHAALGLAGVLAASVIELWGGGDDAVLVLALALGSWATGLGLQLAFARGRALASAIERTRVEHELDRERGAAAERRRIARELHDVLANSLSVVIVQASLAADLAPGDPVAAQRAVTEVERAARRALDELGRMLQLIGDGGSTEPQHGVADLPALADEYSRAGLGVALELDDLALPVGLELSAYRIVQEALTNALKHAPGSVVRVRLAREGEAVALEIRNGRAVAPALTVPGGHGLVGLRERVSLFGGEIDAGPTPDGGYVLAATLPVGE